MTHYKLQVSCLIIVLYIAKVYIMNRKKENLNTHIKMFERLLLIGTVYLCFDMITVFTVNHLDTVNETFNRIAHLIFLLSIDTFLYTTFLYLLSATGYKIEDRKSKIIIHTPYILSVITATLNINNIEYRIGTETNYSMGNSVYVCYVVGIIYISIGIAFFLFRWNYLEKSKRSVLITCLMIMTGVLIIQILFPETLISSIVITITIFGIYMNIENFANIELDRFNQEMIHSFADIIESRDGNTGQHIKRTTVYVKIISQELRKSSKYSKILNQDYIDNLIQAAPMHDIGKIAVSDTILLKPGKLTDEEYAQMKLHTTKGAELLQHTFKDNFNNQYMQMAYEVALYHHEKWNGRGYPYGIEKEDIPLCARIMAVADVFDAVSQNRCYRKAMTLDQSFKIIENGIGTDFDPEIAECFLMARPEVEEAHKQFFDT